MELIIINVGTFTVIVFMVALSKIGLEGSTKACYVQYVQYSGGEIQ
jgi:hypothetical protein